MKNRIKKEEYKITFLYGGVLFLVGLIGMIFPATANYIVTFCFIYGGSSLLIGLLYFGTHKDKFQNKKPWISFYNNEIHGFFVALLEFSSFYFDFFEQDEVKL